MGAYKGWDQYWKEMRWVVKRKEPSGQKRWVVEIVFHKDINRLTQWNEWSKEMRQVVKRDENTWSKEMSCGNHLPQRYQSSHTNKWVVKRVETNGQNGCDEWSKEMQTSGQKRWVVVILPRRHQSSDAKRWVVKRNERSGQKRWKRVVKRDELWELSSTKTSIVSHR